MRVKSKFNTDRSKALFGEPDHPELCKRIAAAIPAEKLRKGRILDCGIGCGGIARAIVNRMVNELYIDHYDAILRVYGIDTNQALVSRARRLGFVNTVCEDFLTWDPQMQFDVIIGNPPFQNGGNSAFYTQFFRKTGELLKEGGYFSLVSPSKAAAKYSKGYKELAKLGLNNIQYGVDSWFPNIEQPVVVYSGSTKNAETKELTVCDGFNQKKVGRDVILPVQYVSGTKAFKDANAALTLSIFEKFFAKSEKLKNRFETLKQAPNCPYVYLASVAWRYHPQRPKGGPYALLATVNQHDQYLNGKFMQFKTEYEAEQMQWLLSRSMLYRFVAAASCRAKFLPRVLIEETPDYLGITSDRELYKVVGLTGEEISYLKLWTEVTA